MDRDALQLKAYKILYERNRLLCQWATGTGKSGVVVQYLLHHPNDTVLIVVPETNNISNWQKEFEKFAVVGLGVTVICYASLHKYKDTHWDLIVFDEVPHIDTEKRKVICDNITADRILALGAIVDEEEMSTLESIYGTFYKWRFSLKQAIENGILPPPTVYVFHMNLDDIEYRHMISGKKYTDAGYYKHLNGKVEEAKIRFSLRASEQNKRTMLISGSKRKRFLGEMKEKAAAYLCDKLKENNRRFICFCSSISQAEKLGGDHSFTSKTPSSMRTLERFNEKEIDSIYVVGKLIEGQNLNHIERGVICQLGGTERITVQEIGRIMRSENPIIYLPVFSDTKDDSFLKTLIYNIPENYIKHYNLSI